MLAERRYRRHFLREDVRRSFLVFTTLAVAMPLFIRNDYVLFGTGPTFVYLATARAAGALVCALAAAMLVGPRSIARVDIAHGLALGAVTLVYVGATPSRWLVGEYLGPTIAGATLSVVVYFFLHGPLWHRAATSSATCVAAITVVWNPTSSMTLVARTTATIAMMALQVVGLLTAFDTNRSRRARYSAEIGERKAQRTLRASLEALAAEKERVETLSKAKSAFLATMSHEFRTPMNAVIGLSDLLADAQMSDESRGHVRAIRDSARSLLVVLNDILDFTKLDASKMVLVPEPFDVRALCRSVLDLLRPGATDVDVRLEFSPDGPVWLTGDDARLRQVLVNLVSNALKFTPRGSVVLRVSVDGDGADATTPRSATFDVIDTGIGIAPDTLARLFRPFEQAEHGAARKYGGTGLGLSISKAIVEAMGGDIRADSELGRGSMFSFTMRLPPAPMPASTPLPAHASTRDPGAPLAVLVVDDNSLNRMVAVGMLERLGQPADVADDGVTAVSAAAAKDYDVILMDLQMPGMGGIDATRAILAGAAGRRRPLVVPMSASVFEEDRAACKDAGMVGFVEKPLSTYDLEVVLQRAGRRRPSEKPSAPRLKAIASLREIEEAGQPGFVATVCREFLGDARARIDRMTTALSASDWTSIEREAHSLTSSSAALGAGELSALSSRIVAASRKRALDEVPDLVGGLKTEFQRVEPELTRHAVGA